jgi:hypothetical protein
MLSIRAADPRAALGLPDAAAKTSLPPDQVSASSARQTNMGDRPPFCSAQSSIGHNNDTTPTHLRWPDRHPAQVVIAKVNR